MPLLAAPSPARFSAPHLPPHLLGLCLYRSPKHRPAWPLHLSAWLATWLQAGAFCLLPAICTFLPPAWRHACQPFPRRVWATAPRQHRGKRVRCFGQHPKVCPFLFTTRVFCASIGSAHAFTVSPCCVAAHFQILTPWDARNRNNCGVNGALVSPHQRRRAPLSGTCHLYIFKRTA